MANIKVGWGWLVTIFFLIALTFGLSLYNTSLILSGDTKTLNESIAYTDRRMTDQKDYVDQRSRKLQEQYLGIAHGQATTNRHLIFLTCMTKKTATECRTEQEELDQLQHESQLPNQ
jgi:hypothetical protein